MQQAAGRTAIALAMVAAGLSVRAAPQTPRKTVWDGVYTVEQATRVARSDARFAFAKATEGSTIVDSQGWP